jgi:hypothetical protein
LGGTRLLRSIWERNLLVCQYLPKGGGQEEGNQLDVPGVVGERSENSLRGSSAEGNCFPFGALYALARPEESSFCPLAPSRQDQPKSERGFGLGAVRPEEKSLANPALHLVYGRGYCYQGQPVAYSEGGRPAASCPPNFESLGEASRGRQIGEPRSKPFSFPSGTLRVASPFPSQLKKAVRDTANAAAVKSQIAQTIVGNLDAQGTTYCSIAAPPPKKPRKKKEDVPQPEWNPPATGQERAAEEMEVDSEATDSDEELPNRKILAQRHQGQTPKAGGLEVQKKKKKKKRKEPSEASDEELAPLENIQTDGEVTKEEQARRDRHRRQENEAKARRVACAIHVLTQLCGDLNNPQPLQTATGRAVKYNRLWTGSMGDCWWSLCRMELTGQRRNTIEYSWSLTGSSAPLCSPPSSTYKLGSSLCQKLSRQVSTV